MGGKAFVERNWAERNGQILRKRLNLGELDLLDPYELARDMGLLLLPFSDIQNLPHESAQQLLVHDPRGWSAIAFGRPGGGMTVVLNPTHADERRRASLMEEVAHVHLKHHPSYLTKTGINMASRNFDAQQEAEAYWVGAAALAPISQLEYAKANGMGLRDLAAHCVVSEELARFRCNMTGVKLDGKVPTL